MPASPPAAGQPRASRLRRGLLIAVGVIVVLLVALQLLAGPIVRHVVNQRLAELEGFSGRVGHVSFSLWRGQAELRELELHDPDYPEAGPVVRLQRATFQGTTRTLVRGQVSGVAELEGLEIVVVKRECVDEPEEELDEQVQQAREQVKRWQNALSDAFPMRLDELRLRDGYVTFEDRTYDPMVKLELTDLHVVARHVHNLPEYEAPPTTIDLTGVTSGGGELAMAIEAEPMAQPLQFYANLRLTEMRLPELAAFTRAYAKMVATEGTFSMYTEIRAAEGSYKGYVRPFVEGLEFEPVRNEEKGLVRRAVETVAGALHSLMENPETEQVATQTPFEGTFEDNEADLWATLENLLRNAFLQAIRQGFDPSEPE